MDLMFKRYSDPISYIDQLINVSSFSKGITTIFKQINEDKSWEYYLYKVYDKTYQDFEKELNDSYSKEMTKKDIETTIKKSKNILNRFTPKDGDKDGIV